VDPISLLMLGALAGAAHVLLAPDHLVALLVFSAEARQRAWRVGLSWGLGHAGAISAVALVFLEARERLRWDFLTGYSDALGALILVAIGAWGLYHVRGDAAPSVPPSAAGSAPAHAPPTHGHIHTRLAFAAGFAGGLVHGVAGHGALFATLPVLGLDRPAAHRYLLAFTAVTVASVIGLTSALGMLSSWPLRSAGADAVRHHPRLLAAAALSCLLCGGLWLVLAGLGFELHWGWGS
jgi:hypothetical protein